MSVGNLTYRSFSTQVILHFLTRLFYFSYSNSTIACHVPCAYWRDRWYTPSVHRNSYKSRGNLLRNFEKLSRNFAKFLPLNPKARSFSALLVLRNFLGRSFLRWNFPKVSKKLQGVKMGFRNFLEGHFHHEVIFAWLKGVACCIAHFAHCTSRPANLSVLLSCISLITCKYNSTRENVTIIGLDMDHAQYRHIIWYHRSRDVYSFTLPRAPAARLPHPVPPTIESYSILNKCHDLPSGGLRTRPTIDSCSSIMEVLKVSFAGLMPLHSTQSFTRKLQNLYLNALKWIHWWWTLR